MKVQITNTNDVPGPGNTRQTEEEEDYYKPGHGKTDDGHRRAGPDAQAHTDDRDRQDVRDGQDRQDVRDGRDRGPVRDERGTQDPDRTDK